MKKNLICIISALLIVSFCPMASFAGDGTSNDSANYYGTKSLSSLNSIPALTTSITETYLEKGKTSKFTVMLTDAVGKVSITTSNKNMVSLSTAYKNSKLTSDGTLYLWLDSEGIDGNASAEITMTGGSNGGNATITVKAADTATLDPAPQKFEASKSVVVSNDNGADGWVKKSGYWYYRKNGSFLTGFQKIEGDWYYLNPSTNGRVVYGLQKINGYYYYFKEGGSGKMLTGFQKINGEWYYFRTGDSGRMLTGFQKIDGNWYYFRTGDSGRMMTGWQYIDGSWFYMDANQGGKVLFGWQKIDGAKHYFKEESESGRLLTGWQKINGSWYYFDTTAHKGMYTGKCKINGKWYEFDTNGVLK